ncbi:TetR/AcrR family transcriptional regulator [Streptomyces sp. NPDC048018]|uniref:TetR/AcrR family transcriptional regulator n=1 Tax=Streptomyces sp. NPDC048018 TaxID=3365499 RepID=UPI00371716B1
MGKRHPAGGSRPGGGQRRGRERRQAFLDAAATVLAEQGYEAATLKAMGEKAGIPTASVYYYFSDRHEVEAELMQGHMGALRELIDGLPPLLARQRTSLAADRTGPANHGRAPGGRGAGHGS